ncbi:ABC transporter ATP-binding protein [Clostridiaceae bacterium M8S5]|nr:ABC transporter ATP-binding protein [Clostridiaceae bacterium M8S5]
MLRLENVTKFYGDFKAVDGLSIELKKGNIYGFVGPNGAGKTTIFKMIATLLKPSGGKIFLNNQNIIKKYKYARGQIGYMPDFFGVYNDMKTYEYMEFYLDINYISQKDKKKKIDELLELVNMKDKKNKYVDSLSRGMKQKLCLARCLLKDPSVIILDEPASGMDPKSRIEMKKILKNLKHKDKVILISSHILHELSELCDEIIILDSGKVDYKGSLDDIVNEVCQTNILEIKLLDKTQEMIKVLKNYNGVVDVVNDIDSIKVNFTGDQLQISNLLRHLISSDFKIVSFSKMKNDLEDVFIKLTGGDNND